jgi:hypothetical protein
MGWQGIVYLRFFSPATKIKELLTVHGTDFF